MGKLIIKVEDEEGKPIPSAHFSGKSHCAWCVYNCHDNNLAGDSNTDGIITVDTQCGMGGGTAWGYVSAEGYTTQKVNTGLDYYGGDTHISIGLHKEAPTPPPTQDCNTNNDCKEGYACVNGKCVCNSSTLCPKGYICYNHKCVKPSNDNPIVKIEAWLKEYWYIVVFIALLLIVLFIFYRKGKGGYSLTKAMQKVGQSTAKATGKAVSEGTGIIKDLAILGA